MGTQLANTTVNNYTFMGNSTLFYPAFAFDYVSLLAQRFCGPPQTGASLLGGTWHPKLAVSTYCITARCPPKSPLCVLCRVCC